MQAAHEELQKALEHSSPDEAPNVGADEPLQAPTPHEASTPAPADAPTKVGLLWMPSAACTSADVGVELAWCQPLAKP